MDTVTTWTIMTTATDRGTTSVESKITESAESALAHVEAMDQCAPVAPVRGVASRGRRWTWEYVAAGVRCTDTVRVY